MRGGKGPRVSDSIDFSFQVLQTTIRVIYGDITQIDADALVGSDGADLSAKL